MMLKEYSVLGHKVKYNVTESSTEFNKLDPKRIDAANEEAIATIVYRVMNPDTRYYFLHGRDAVEAKDGQAAVTAIKGVEEQMMEMITNDAAEEHIRKEEHKRATANLAPLTDGQKAQLRSPRITKVVLDKNGKPRLKDGVEITSYDESEEKYYNRVLALSVTHKKFASEDAARAHFQPLIEAIAIEVPFDVSERERAERGPKKLAAMYKLAAAKALTRDLVARINKKQLGVMEPAETFTPTKDMSVLYTGKFPDRDKAGNEVQVNFTVSDKDAETLGWALKRFFDWKRSQEMENVVA